MEQATQRIKTFLKQQALQDDRLNALLKMKIVSTSQTHCIFEYPTQGWQLNPVGMLHGGMIASMFDFSMGLQALIYSEAYFVPTIHLSVNYVAPIYEKDIVRVESYLDHLGGKVVQSHSIAYVNDKVVASAQASYSIVRK